MIDHADKCASTAMMPNPVSIAMVNAVDVFAQLNTDNAACCPQSWAQCCCTQHVVITHAR